MKEKVLVIVILIMTVISLSVMVAVGVLYFSQLSDKDGTVETMVQTQGTGSNGQANSKNENTKTQDSKADAKTMEDKSAVENEEYNDEILKITAVGDILLGRSVGLRVIKQPSRYAYPFEKVADFLRRGDIVFGNLEESITSSTKGLTGIKQGGKYVLKNEVEAIEGLKYAGFNLFSLANNHILDYYEKGLYDTIEILNKNGIAYAGAGRNLEEARKLTIIEKKGIKVGLLAYTDMAEITYKGNPPLSFLAKDNKSGVAPTKIEYIREDMAKARGMVDLLIVSLHWGIEYTYEPTKKQVEIAHEIIDQGADILIGHHTHRFQSIEIYKEKPIFYSLGNFIFDQRDPENQQGFLMEMEYKDKKLARLSGIPFKIRDVSQIVPQSGKDAAEIIYREIKLCEKMDTPSHMENDKIIFDIKN
ncbi:MAG: CapA family protein [Clostridia bacterium]|nr:CapA family protein [Clostridia bacterium]